MRCEARASKSSRNPIGESLHASIVVAVGLHALRFAQRPSAPSGNRRQAIQQGHEVGRVVTIRARENRIQRRTADIDEEVMLAVRLAPISRVGPCFFPHAQPAPRSCRQSRARNRAGRHGAVRPVARGAACSTRPPFASRALGANTSCLSRIPFPGAAF
jgi:hypothetical protein